MKRRKTLCILLAILAVCCIVTFIVTRIKERQEQIKNTDEEILAVDPDTVESLSWTYEDTTLSFHKVDGEWQWDDDEAFPVDADKIQDLLSTFESFGASFVIEDVDDYSQYGLDEPTCTISFATEDQEYLVKLGDYSSMDKQRYVSIDDGNAYLLKTDPFDSFEIELSDTIRNDDTPVFSQINSVEFQGQDTFTATLDEDSKASYCSSDKYFTQIDGMTLPLDTTRLEDYCDAISDLELSDYVSYNVTDEELADWGLDQPEVTVTVNYTTDDAQEECFTLNLGRNQEELAKKTAAEEKGKDYTDTVTAYVRVGDSPIVYTISESDYTTLSAASYNDIRHNEVMTADFDTVTSIDIKLEDKDYTLTAKKSKKDDQETYTYNDEDFDFTDLHSAISSLLISEFTDDEPGKKEEISMVFHLDNEDFPEIPLEIYRYDGTSCLVVLNGETLGLVNRSDVVDLIEEVNAIILG